MRAPIRLFLLSALLIGPGACGGGGGSATGDAGADAAGDAGADGAGDASGGDGSDSTGGDGGIDGSSDPGPDLGGRPDPAFVHAVENTAAVSATATYVIDETRPLREPENLFGTAIRVVATPGGELTLGLDTGLRRLRSDGLMVPLSVPGATAPVLDVAAQRDGEGRVVAITETQVKRVNPETGVGTAFGPGGMTLRAVAIDATGAPLLATSVGVRRVEGDTVGLPAGPLGKVTAQVADIEVGPDGTTWFVAGGGLTAHYKDAAELKSLLPAGSGVRAIAVGRPGNTLWAATADGAARVVGEVLTLMPAGVDGLATGDTLAVAASSERVVLGHAIGATVLNLDAAGEVIRRDYITSGRSLNDLRVAGVGIDGSGSAWLGGAKGLSRVDWVEHTLAEKAEAMETLLDDHFWRLDGFVASDATIDDPWKPTTWSLGDKDNDGLWTQMQIGAWCYAFGATGDTRYRDQARRAMENMKLLVDLPAIDFEKTDLGRGYIARSFVREDEGSVWDDKKGQDNWHLVRWEGQDWRWKDDTSSDETAGHFFGFPLYYDLCAADDAERAEVASYAADVARYIAENGWFLLDLDGKPTTHGHWDPLSITAAVDGIESCEAGLEVCLDSFGGGGWLNSVEILGQMLSTWHMTADPYFLDKYEELLAMRYGEVAMPHDLTATITIPNTMNHSDHELAMLAYHTLIRYEPDDERRAMWQEGLQFLYDHERVERNPLWAAFVAVLTGADKADISEALQSLREMPFDRRDFAIDNSHRRDATEWPKDRFDRPQFAEVFPYDEIGTVWWNGNFHVKQFGGNGKNVSGPMAWLLPYWTLRYAGVISE
jgi:hypothetical protein